jgi:C-terminal processing protease CtpA/Prc
MRSDVVVHTKRRFPARRPGRLGLVAVLAVLAATPAAAQRDTVVVRRVSTWQRDVERLRQQLVDERRNELEFFRLLQGLEARMDSARHDSVRFTVRAQSQLVTRQLREINASKVRIQRSIESLCSGVQKPDGWLGVVTTGVSMVDHQGDGPQVVRYMEPPVVESVDPGSPADRVGLRSGDVLVSIGGQPLLRRDIVFAELLRPGQKIEVTLQRGGRILRLMPLVEPTPESFNRTPCSMVDASTAYILAPTVEARPFAGVLRRDAPREVRVGAVVRTDRADTTSAVTSGSFGYAGPMVNLFTRGVNPVAGVQLVSVNEELSQATGVEQGLLVIQVLPGTVGREAGLRIGDVLVEADSQVLRSAVTLQRVISRSTDRTVTLTVIRADKKREKVTLKW